MKKILVVLLLMFIILSVVPTRSAQAVGSVTTDQKQYVVNAEQPTVNVKISGNVANAVNNGVVLSISKPDGSSETLNLITTNRGDFETLYPLYTSSPSGQYEITASYQNFDFSSTTFILLSGTSTGPSTTPTPIHIPTTPSANEIDMARGAGSSATAACVSANNCFSPNPMRVIQGTTVTWKNTDTVSHYVTSGHPSDITPGTIFDSSNLIKPGGTYQFTFVIAGTFDYFCTVHPWMIGQVVVGSVNNARNPTTTIVSSSLNPSTSSQLVTFRAKVSPAVPDGEMVTFLDGATTLGTASTIESIATITTFPLKAGLHTIIAKYSGDSSNGPSSGTEYLVVNPVPLSQSSTSLTFTSSEVTVGSSTMISAHVTGSSPSGTVTFSAQSGTFNPQECTLDSSGQCSVAYTPTIASTVQITANYNGDGSNSPSSGTGQLAEPFNLTPVIIGIVLTSAVSGVIFYMKFKKPATIQTPNDNDTQFYGGCPHCRGDTISKNGRQFCNNCNQYL